MTPGPPASRQYTLRAMPSSATMEGTISPEMERSVRRVSFAESDNKNTLLQEVEKRHEHGVHITKMRCAELDGAAHLRLTYALISSVRHNHPFTGGNVILCDFVRANRLFTGGDDISVVEVTKI